MNRKELKMRLLLLEKSQADIVRELNNRGFKNLKTTTFSSYLSRRVTGPQADAVLKLTGDIVENWEKEAK